MKRVKIFGRLSTRAWSKIFGRLFQKRVLFFCKNKMVDLGFVVEKKCGHLGFVVIFLRPKGVKGGFASRPQGGERFVEGLLENVRERS